jgi:hypothetical protein
MNNKNLVKIEKSDVLYAIIVKNEYEQKGLSFFTTDDLSQQLAYMNHPKGKVIEPHIHNLVRREVHHTQEVLFLKKGKLRADFYDEKQKYLESYILYAGDTLMLIRGGHGFEVIEEIVMLEVKQGPFLGEQDKTRFNAIENDGIVLK